METVIKIVEKFLRENKFDGLYSPDMECGCRLEDLAPCGNIEENCTAGYKQKHTSDPMEPWVVGPVKEQAAPNE